MKKGFILVLLALALVLTTFTAGAVTSQASVSAASNVGTIEVTIPAEEATVAGTVTVSFDNRVLTYASAASETDVYSVATASSSVTVYYSCLEEYTGDLAVLTFTYDASKAGSTVISITIDAYAPDVDEPVTTTEKVTLALPTEAGVCPSAVFTDVDTDEWYHEAVDYVLNSGLMVGLTTTTFGPDETTTRAMFVTVLGRLAGVDTDSYTESTFTDVEVGEWYAPYVQWAYENGIVNGYTSEIFAPDAIITREEMCVILYRYASYQGVDVTNPDLTVLDAFADAADVDDWAQDAMAWSISNGIIVGGYTGLDPLGSATRAQMATVIMRYAQADF